MKKLSLILLLACMAFPASAFADCKSKIAVMERELGYAKAHGNTHRIAGFETALEETRANCTDSALKAKKDAKVEEKQRKVKKAEEELEKAKLGGKKDKIAKRERKLEEARQELKEAEARRNGF